MITALCRDCLWSGEAQPIRCPDCGSPRVVRHAELGALAIAHLDCDAFYASVEKRDRPELRDVPVIVGGGKRGVVTTACYIARTYGARSAMPMFKALRLCPDAVVIRPDFAKYSAESRRIMALLRALTPLVQPLSLDEAWLDLSGTERLNGGPPAWVLARAQAEIERQTGLTLSVGLASNKFLAKIASDLDKPRGFAVLGSDAQALLAGKPVGILPGVGPVFVRSLNAAGFATVGDLARAEPRRLADQFGPAGLRLHRLAHGQDVREVEPDSERKSISAETTFNDDLAGLSDLEDQLWPLCEKVAERTRRSGSTGRVVTLKLRTADFRILTRRRTLTTPTQTARVLFGIARRLLHGEADGRRFRLIGVGLSDLMDGAAEALLFDAQEEGRALSTETAVDRLRERFGKAAVITGRALRSGETAARPMGLGEAMESDKETF
jgi:DNA polymerase-4